MSQQQCGIFSELATIMENNPRSIRFRRRVETARPIFRYNPKKKSGTHATPKTACTAVSTVVHGSSPLLCASNRTKLHVKICSPSTMHVTCGRGGAKNRWLEKRHLRQHKSRLLRCTFEYIAYTGLKATRNNCELKNFRPSAAQLVGDEPRFQSRVGGGKNSAYFCS